MKHHAHIWKLQVVYTHSPQCTTIKINQIKHQFKKILNYLFAKH